MQNKPSDVKIIEEEKTSVKKESHGFLKEVLQFAIIAFFIVLPVRIYIAQPFLVSGSSMSPTFENGNYLIIDEISYRFNKPQRGDVVVFKFPQDPSKFFIKRVIGLPGESVQIKDGKVYITKSDEEASPELATIELKEEYIKYKHRENIEPILLTAKEYFVMGDNRPGSSDSRYWGPLPERLIKGRAFLRLFPLGQIGIFPGQLN